MKQLRAITLMLMALVLFTPVLVWAQVQSDPGVVLTHPIGTITNANPPGSGGEIGFGDLAGSALTWVLAVFGTSIGSLLTAWLFRLFKLAGIQASEALRIKLQEIIVNGLNAGADALKDRMAGRGKVEVKNAVVAEAVAYVQDHGADTLKQLGLDPKDNAAVDAIKARIETAINDPLQPTPAVLDPMPAPVKMTVDPGFIPQKGA